MKLSYGTQSQVSFKDIRDYYYALGFLANSRNAELRWENNEEQGAWGSEGRIHCLVPETQFPQCFRFTAGRGNVYARINCNDYVGQLVMHHNFSYNGRFQNLNRIIETVPEQYRDVFQAGYGKPITNMPSYVGSNGNIIASNHSGTAIHSESIVGDQHAPEKAKKRIDLRIVQDKCMVEAKIKQTQGATRLVIDLSKYPKQKVAIGKTIGDEIDLGISNITYVVTGIYSEE